jgi:lipopolysaccharide/colanic/teichoic acid biosynthesis glycosyltransferase
MDGIQRNRPFPLAPFAVLLSVIITTVTLFAALPLWPVMVVFAALASTVAYLSRRQRRAALGSLLAFEPCPISAVTPEGMEIELSRIAQAAIDGDGPFPPYVHRGGEDNRIRGRLKTHRMVIVAGNRYAGKTRTALEAIRSGRRGKVLLLRSASGKDNPLRALLSAPWLIPKRSRCFLFVDSLDSYLDGIQQHDIDAWLTARPKAALVATISSKALRTALDPDSTSFDRNKWILDRDKSAGIEDEVSDDALGQAQAIYGPDPELVRLGSYLGGGPAVENRYADARIHHPVAWGIVTAAIIAARAGIPGGLTQDHLLELARRLDLFDESTTEEALTVAIEFCRQEPEGIMGMLLRDESSNGELLLRANSILVRENLEPPGERASAHLSLATRRTVADVLAKDQATCVRIARAAWLHAGGSEADRALMEFALELLWSEEAERDVEREMERVALSLATALIDELERDGPPQPLEPPKPLPMPDQARALVQEVIDRRGVTGGDRLFEPALPPYWTPPPFYTRRGVRDMLRFILLVACDLSSTALGIALGIAASNRVLGDSEPFASVASGAAIAFPLLIVLFAYQGLYRPDSKRAQLPEIVSGMAIAALVLVLVAMASGLEPSALFQIMVSAIGASAAVFFSRAAYDRGSRKWVKERVLVARTLFVAPAESARLSAELVRQTSRRPMQAVGFVSSEKASDPAQLSTRAEFGEVLGEFFVDHVILADPGLSIRERGNLAAICHARGIRVELFPVPVEIAQEAGEALSDLSVPLIEIPPPYVSPFNALVKRTFDVLVGTALCIPAAVLAAVLALVLWVLGLGKPPIAQVPRLGRNRVRFPMYRFHIDANFAVAEWVNAFLRRSHLDELPQLYNVLHGEMSLVGPRPLNDREYSQLDDVKRHRYAVKPGITGLWQVTRRIKPLYDDFAPMELMARLDLIYCRRWSPLLDFTILLRTLWACVRSSEPD